MSTQQDINAIRAQRFANTHDPLALMANTQTPFHPDHSSLITYIQHPQPNNNFVQQPSFNTNYMQQPMQNPKDISDPTTALDMALELMSKAFQLNNITPTNNNQRSSSNPCYSQIAQSGIANQGMEWKFIAARSEDAKNRECTGPFTIANVYPYGTIELFQKDGQSFKVNGHRVKHYFGEDVPKEIIPDVKTDPP
ncbi:hypothetical protein Tco_0565719 [Tanacetum coccineum]